MPAETRYARVGEHHVAYQVVGTGSPTLVLVPGWISHVEHMWEDPAFAHMLRRFSSFSRLVVFDRRGTGLSDPVTDLPTMEERMDEVRAVMDAAGAESAALLGISEGGPMCMLFAATYPERTTALILLNTFARNFYGEDCPWGMRPEQVERFLKIVDQGWGTGVSVPIFAPSRAQDEDFVRRFARFERNAVSPRSARTLLANVMSFDVRHILSSIRVPTLVLHRADDRAVRAEAGRYLAHHIPGARYVELAGVDHLPWASDTEPILDEVERFLTGVRRGAATNRLLATVLFADMVDSTARAAALGDSAWARLLERYHEIVGEEVTHYRGRRVNTAGDGFLAAFDGPGRGIQCAVAIRDAVTRLGVQVRAGLHTGECEVIGHEIGGIAVHLGARVAALAAAGEILVTSTVKDLVVGSALRFTERGRHTLKGVPGEWQLLAVEG